tara:strand:+ start:471 stop:1190 length:720 start_codon:yes stop_codon:yes gene_type:complete
LILTPRQFITATTYRFIGRRKNPILLNIDQILQVYHTRYWNPSGVLSHQPSRSESYARWRNNTLASLGVNCCLYLDSKSQRDTTKRKTAVAGLLVSVWHELNLPPRDFRASWNPRQLCQELMAACQSDKRVTAAWQQAGTRVKRLNRGGTGTGLRSLDLNDLWPSRAKYVAMLLANIGISRHQCSPRRSYGILMTSSACVICWCLMHNAACGVKSSNTAMVVNEKFPTRQATLVVTLTQ